MRCLLPGNREGVGGLAKLVMWATALVAVPAVAQVATPLPMIQTEADAVAQDAAEYARRFQVPLSEAVRRLRAQQDSVLATDRLEAEFRDRLAGIAIEHNPFRIVVRLTGDTPVAPRAVLAGGTAMPVLFRTGAPATRAAVVAAITQYQAELRAALSKPPGLGFDPSTGELVVLVAGSDADAFGPTMLRDQIAEQTGVPVRIRSLDRPDIDLAEGGARVVGARDGRRYACTTGFVVTDGVRSGVVTAAHCPDALDYVEGGTSQPLEFAGQWGWGFQDVQLHLGGEPLRPFFFADTAKTLLRPVTGTRPLASTRGGEWVCHRGERTGYSCATVELTDFAPAGDLCGGACLPRWVAVSGPTCKAGDSGGPVFAGTLALGIVKGGSYRGDGSCGFYFYMSTDFLPEGWSVAHASDAGVEVGEQRAIGLSTPVVVQTQVPPL